MTHPNNQSSNVLEVCDLTKHYKTSPALEAISLKIAQGSCTGLVGPNGAGKTTLLSILQGTLPATSGKVSVLGEKPDINNREFMRRIGVGSQSIAFSPFLTVRELFELYSTIYGKGWNPNDLIERIGLREKAGSRFGRLSGGQKKRVSVALALIGDPEFLMLDEPTGDLDPQARQLVWELIRDVAGRKRTVLLATHQMEEVESLCDEVVILDHGKIIDFGSPDQLINRHCPGYGVKFEVAAGFDLALTGVSIGDVKMGGRSSTAQCFFPDLDAAHQAVTDIRKVGGGSIESFSIQRMTLHDVFIKVTGKELRD